MWCKRRRECVELARWRGSSRKISTISGTVAYMCFLFIPNRQHRSAIRELVLDVGTRMPVDYGSNIFRILTYRHHKCPDTISKRIKSAMQCSMLCNMHYPCATSFKTWFISILIRSIRLIELFSLNLNVTKLKNNNMIYLCFHIYKYNTFLLSIDLSIIK